MQLQLQRMKRGGGGRLTAREIHPGVKITSLVQQKARDGGGLTALGIHPRAKNKINVGRNSILDDASQISKFQIEIWETGFCLGSTFQDSISVIFHFLLALNLKMFEPQSDLVCGTFQQSGQYEPPVR